MPSPSYHSISVLRLSFGSIAQRRTDNQFNSETTDSVATELNIYKKNKTCYIIRVFLQKIRCGSILFSEEFLTTID